MTAFLFLQRFEQGAVAPIPLQPLMDILSRYGKMGRGRGDLEITFEPDTVAFGCTVVGDAQTGVRCVGFERPRYDAALRQLAWECVEQFNCATFNDVLDLVYTTPAGAAALPATLRAAAACGVRTLGSAQQLWPDQLELAVAGPPRPAVAYANPNSNGPNFQMFDHADTQSQELWIEAGIRPEACNAGTLRVLRNLELRVDAAIGDNPEFKALYRYAHHAASLLVLESPRLTYRAMHATFVSAMPDEPVPKREQPDFIADSAVFANAIQEANALAAHVYAKYQLTLDGKEASLDALAGLLDKLHHFYLHERSKHPAGAPFHSALAATWAVRAGCYLGGMVRTQIGGQWGSIQRGNVRLPAVHVHGGRLCFPQQQVLDHVINGETDNIATWFRALAQSDASPTPRHEDFACDIPALAGMLLGEGALPYGAHIPHAQLDFSVASLRHLDTYLAHVAQDVGGVPERALGKLVLAAGAYLGEVVRMNAADPACWQWVNYDDFVMANPDFAHQRPRDPGFLAFLDSAHQTSYPLQHVGAFLTGEGKLGTVDFAAKLLI